MGPPNFLHRAGNHNQVNIMDQLRVALLDEVSDMAKTIFQSN